MLLFIFFLLGWYFLTRALILININLIFLFFVKLFYCLLSYFYIKNFLCKLDYHLCSVWTSRIMWCLLLDWRRIWHNITYMNYINYYYAVQYFLKFYSDTNVQISMANWIRIKQKRYLIMEVKWKLEELNITKSPAPCAKRLIKQREKQN